MKSVNYEEYINENVPDLTGLIEELKKDETILYTCKVNHIPMEEIEKHPSKAQAWLKQINLCRGCTGLDTCKQKTKGFAENLEYDGILTVNLEPCAYLKKKRQLEQHLDQFVVNDMGSSFCQASFQNVQKEGEDPDYIRVWMDAKTLCDEGKGAYIYGNIGTGKTYLAACAANQLAKEGKRVAFVHCPRFVERINNTAYTGEYRQEVERLTYANFVVFDDIGAEAINERYRSVLLAILDARMQNNRMTWFTSNEDFTSLQDHFLTTNRGGDLNEAMRIIERIQVLSKPLKLVGENRRHV